LPLPVPHRPGRAPLTRPVPRSPARPCPPCPATSAVCTAAPSRTGPAPWPRTRTENTPGHGTGPGCRSRHRCRRPARGVPGPGRAVRDDLHLPSVMRPPSPDVAAETAPGAEPWAVTADRRADLPVASQVRTPPPGMGRAGSAPEPQRRLAAHGMRQREPAGRANRAHRVIRERNIRGPKDEQCENRTLTPPMRLLSMLLLSLSATSTKGNRHQYPNRLDHTCRACRHSWLLVDPEPRSEKSDCRPARTHGSP